jgi:hypothetical protein
VRVAVRGGAALIELKNEAAGSARVVEVVDGATLVEGAAIDVDEDPATVVGVVVEVDSAAFDVSSVTSEPPGDEHATTTINTTYGNERIT